MLIIGSRFPSEWLDPWASWNASALEDGSPIDRLVFFGLILFAAGVLFHRRVQLYELVRNNIALTFYLVYCFIAIFWSDFPFVAFKRWIKVLGHPIMALIILTEPNREEAVRRLMKRCAYVLIPVSILFIKYYPDLGRGYDDWTGRAFHMGITNNKNALGYVCMILGIFFAWYLMSMLRSAKKVSRGEQVLSIGFLVMIAWLLLMADSQTPLVCLVAAVVILAFLGISAVNKRYIGTYLTAAVLTFIVAELLGDVYASTLRLLGRNPTLTDRTDLWQEVLKVEINPLLGAGFESFWLGDRMERLWEIFRFHPNQAHNGYLETYLNLGLLGVGLLIALIIATFSKAKIELLRNPEFGSLRMALLIAILIYNYTEAVFKAVHLVWFAFYIIALDYPTHSTASPHPGAGRRPDGPLVRFGAAQGDASPGPAAGRHNRTLAWTEPQ